MILEGEEDPENDEKGFISTLWNANLTEKLQVKDAVFIILAIYIGYKIIRYIRRAIKRNQV